MHTGQEGDCLAKRNGRGRLAEKSQILLDYLLSKSITGLAHSLIAGYRPRAGLPDPEHAQFAPFPHPPGDYTRCAAMSGSGQAAPTEARAPAGAECCAAALFFVQITTAADTVFLLAFPKMKKVPPAI